MKLVLPIALLSFVFGTQLAHGVRVQTEKHGIIEGTSIPSLGLEQFLGIPVAKSTAGERRFRRPEAVDEVSADTIVNATVAGLACPQPMTPGREVPSSEDCLDINIQRPANVTENDSLPVLVWIYGGGFVVGYSTRENYNGTHLIQHSKELGEPIIYVTLNYRLGLFGFLAGDEIDESDQQGTAALNAGFHDQRLALQWVRDNIHNFGGDPTKITTIGQSAGAASASVQMLANGGQVDGLFRASIQLSGSPTTLPHYEPRQRDVALAPQNAYEAVLNETNCDSLACLRRLNTSVLDRVNTRLISQGTVFLPTTDRYFLPQHPAILLQNASNLPHIPFISSQNTDEGTGLTQWAPIAGLEGAARGLAGFLTEYESNNPALRQLYPNITSAGSPFRPELFGFAPNDTILSGNASAYKRDAAILGDVLFTSGRRAVLEAYDRAKVPVYSYLFEQPTTLQNRTLGLWHGGDLSFAFGIHVAGYTANATSTTPYDQAMAQHATQANMDRTREQLTTIIISFVNHVDPNAHSDNGRVDARMPRWRHSSPRLLRFTPNGATDISSDKFRKDQNAYITRRLTEVNS